MAGLFEDLSDRWDSTKNFVTRPLAWVRTKVRASMWSTQRQILKSIVKNRYTAVYSCHDSGKSWTAAQVIAWWIDSHPVGEAFVVSTAPTAAQVAAIMWREVSKTHRIAELDGKINRAGYPQWYIGSELVGYGRKPADYEQSAFQGIHAKYVLVVIDEACGVQKALYDQIDALVTNEYARVLAIGNPDDAGSHFATAICKPDSGWNVIQIDGLRTPNMTKANVIGYRRDGFGYDNPKYPLLWALMRAEGTPFSTEQIPDDMRPMLLSPLWIEERIQRWAGFGPGAHLAYTPEELEDVVRRRCASSPIFQAKVRGQFPTEATTGVIPLGWVQAAVNRWHDVMDDPKAHPATSMRAATPGRRVLGIDIGGEGEDETVFSIRYGNIIEKLLKYRIADTTEIVDNAAQYLHEPGSLAVVDVIGIGAGVFHLLNRYKADSVIVGTPLKFNAAASTPRVDQIGEFRFRNDRAAAWWNLRELLDPSKGSNLCLPDDERMIAELVSVRYKLNVGGIIQIESKDDIRKRLGRSTDSADAVIQAFWIDTAAGDMEAVEWGATNGRDVIGYDGYDPFTDADLSQTPGFGTGSQLRLRQEPRPFAASTGWDHL